MKIKFRFLFVAMIMLMLMAKVLNAVPLGPLYGGVFSASDDYRVRGGESYLLFEGAPSAEQRSSIFIDLDRYYSARKGGFDGIVDADGTYRVFSGSQRFLIVTYDPYAGWRYHASRTERVVNGRSEFTKVLVKFEPLPNDTLVAKIDFSTTDPNRLQLLKGLRYSVNGIRAGYEEGDLSVYLDQFEGERRVDNVEIRGTYLKLNDEPTWWLKRFDTYREGESDPFVSNGVVSVEISETDHLVPANLGQAKWMVKNALEEIYKKSHLMASAIQEGLVGSESTHPLSVWPPERSGGNDLSLLTAGQLKALAVPFYDFARKYADEWLEKKMAAAGNLQMDTHYPWGAEVGESNNFAVVNLGQLKSVFSLPFSELPAVVDLEFSKKELASSAKLSFDFDVHPNIPNSNGYSFDSGLLSKTSNNMRGKRIEFPSTSAIGFGPKYEFFTHVNRSFSVSFWARIKKDADLSMDGGISLLTIRSSASQTRMEARLVPGNILQLDTFRTRGSNNRSYAEFRLPGSLNDGEWHFITFTHASYTLPQGTSIVHDTVSGRVALFFDGNTVGSLNGSEALIDGISAGNRDTVMRGITIGDAELDGIRIYDRAVQSEPLLAYNEDTDGDGISDHAEVSTYRWADKNGDREKQSWEFSYISHPLVPSTSVSDFDEDGIPDSWEQFYGLDPFSAADAELDPDGDDLTNYNEWRYRGDPNNSDTDADGIDDGEEVRNGTSPNIPDFPDRTDSDGDGMPDAWEIKYGLDPNSAADAGFDADGDGLTNLEEWQHGANPTLVDTDGDGHSDKVEVDRGHSPTVAGAGGAGGEADSDESEPRTAAVEFKVGDESGSGSEKWKMLIKQTEGEPMNEPFEFTADSFSDLTTRTFQLQEGASYEVTLEHVETRTAEKEGEELPDYDWSAFIVGKDGEDKEDKPSTPVLKPEEEGKYFIIGSDKIKWIVDNEEGLLGKHDGSGNAGEKTDNKTEGVKARLLPVEIVPDYNRDGKITGADRGQISEENPWRFWRNSDDDSGAGGGDDIQGSDEPDYWGNAVDGVRDLVDFFPVHFDLKAVLEALPQTDYQYFLKHESQSGIAGGAIPAPTFNVIWYPEADLEADPTGANGVGSFLKNLNRGQDIAGRTSHTIPARPVGAGLQIPENMLTAFKDGKGVALFEARFETNNPIVLEIKKNDGTSVAEIEMPVRISEVESMFRSKYLNENLAGGTQGGVPGEPSNWPDADRNGKHFVLVHGYNVSGEQARGWHSETFKRMFWSGSNAMFTGVSWHGNEGQIAIGGVTPDYWRNVHNAFQTSKSVADFVNALPGSGKAIAAHSLGNMVVSSAIKDHGLNVSQYYMLDAAVALEAYSPGMSNKAQMSHPDWRGYVQHLWATDWHKLFAASDGRNKLTWLNRFGNLPQAYNFHSTGEEVLKNGTGAVPSIGAVRSWVYQEMTKGFSIGSGGGIFHNGTGGWDFNGHYDDWPLVPGVGVPISPADAAAIPHADLEEEPFFDPFSNDDLHDSTKGSAEASKYDERAKVLAESLPSLTFAAGSNSIASFTVRNFDMMNMKNGWPRGNADWLHSDIRNVAYLYTYKVYDKFVELGGLK